MSCIKTFDNNATTGLFSGSNWSTNGVVEFLGYSTVSGGPFGAGGNWPWATNSWGTSIDTDDIIEGFYRFKYKSMLAPTDPCYGEIEFTLAVVQGAFDFPTSPVQISLCSGDPIRNIFTDSGLFGESAVNPVTVAIAGSGTTSPGYNAGAAGDITDDTYDPSAETSFPVTRTFDITYTPTAPGGYTLDGCENCDPQTLTVEYTVTEAFQVDTVNQIAVCNDGDA